MLTVLTVLVTAADSLVWLTLEWWTAQSLDFTRTVPKLTTTLLFEDIEVETEDVTTDDFDTALAVVKADVSASEIELARVGAGVGDKDVAGAKRCAGEAGFSLLAPGGGGRSVAERGAGRVAAGNGRGV